MVKHMIGDYKMMVTIVWNPQGFHFVDALPKGQKFNANYYIDRILQPFLKSRSTGRGPGFIIHADNARSHIARKTFKFLLGKPLRNGVPSTILTEISAV
jgi:hypothetical protein